MTPPASRDAPCPCGSGRRYKECHGALDVGSPATVGVLDSDQLLAEGQEALERGNLASALARIDQGIAVRPDHAPFHLLRGRALLVALRPAEAEAAARKAIAPSCSIGATTRPQPSSLGSISRELPMRRPKSGGRLHCVSIGRATCPRPKRATEGRFC